MLNIIVINCDDKRVEYEWGSAAAFVADIDSDNENIPMLDDTLVEVNADDETLYLWWKNEGGISVNDLYERCEIELERERSER